MSDATPSARSLNDEKFIEEICREAEGLGIICLSDIIDAEITVTETGERMLIVDFEDGSSDAVVLKGAPPSHDELDGTEA